MYKKRKGPTTAPAFLYLLVTERMFKSGTSQGDGRKPYPICPSRAVLHTVRDEHCALADLKYGWIMKPAMARRPFAHGCVRMQGSTRSGGRQLRRTLMPARCLTSCPVSWHPPNELRFARLPPRPLQDGGRAASHGMVFSPAAQSEGAPWMQCCKTQMHTGSAHEDTRTSWLRVLEWFPWSRG